MRAFNDNIIGYKVTFKETCELYDLLSNIGLLYRGLQDYYHRENIW